MTEDVKPSSSIQVQVLYSLGHIYTSVTSGILYKIFYIMTDITNLK